MTIEDYAAKLDQRLARMSETARLAAAFYKGLIAEGIDRADATQMTAIYAITINQDEPEE
jgi:hypothetical protein